MADRPLTGEELRQDPKIKDISNALYWSFEFSQGTTTIQREIYNYLHVARPNWKVAPPEQKQIAKLVQDRVLKRFFEKARKPKPNKPFESQDPSHIKVFYEDAAKQAGDECDRLVTNLNENILPSEEGRRRMIERLTDLIIVRDSAFLIGKGKGRGRPRRKNYSGSSRFDPWLSHIQYYAIAGNPAPTPEYTQMFGDIRNWLKEKIMNGQIEIDYKNKKDPTSFGLERLGNDLSSLARIWEQKHRGMNFFQEFNLPEGVIKK